MIAAAAGATNHSLTDYLPRWGQPEVVAQQPVDAMVEALKRLAKKNRKD